VPPAQPAPPAPQAEPADAKPQKPSRVDREAKARAEREAKERAKAEREAKARADREAKARVERDAKSRAEREAQDRAYAERDERARSERDKREADRLAAAAAVPEGLSQDQIQKVLTSSRKAFDGCIQSAGKSGEVPLDGRKVLLRLNIQSSGAVTYPTFDDVTLNGTELGSCLKSAARVMVFPKFKGDNLHVEVPLVLAGGR
jgi:TolA protein